MKKLVIIGAGGLGRETAWMTRRINESAWTWKLLGFLDGNPALIGSEIGRLPVLGAEAWLRDHPDVWAVCAIGDGRVRKKVVEGVMAAGHRRFATLVDPDAVLSDSVEMGEGTLVCGRTILTVHVALGRHVVVSPGCTVGHDARMDDYSTLYPGVNLSGNTHIGPCVQLGCGSQVIQGKRVGRGTIVGAGAVVISDLPEACTAVGVPARPIKFHEAPNAGDV